MKDKSWLALLGEEVALSELTPKDRSGLKVCFKQNEVCRQNKLERSSYIEGMKDKS